MTQNPNESFNSTVWERVTKTVYSGLEIIQLAVYDAVANYNYGRQATLHIFELLSMAPGCYTTRMCHILNMRREYNAAHHNKPATRKRRKVIRGGKKKNIDKLKLTEGVTYELVDFKYT